MSVPVESGGSSLNVDADTLIDSLKMAFMGSLDAHNGRWGMFTDVLYHGPRRRQVENARFLDRHDRPSGDHHRGSEPRSQGHDLDDGRRVPGGIGPGVEGRSARRGAVFRPQADAQLVDLRRPGPIGSAGRSGSKEIDETVWDGIVGVKGAYAFGADRRWSVPFYFDIGTGQSDLTWQAAAGIAYSYHWGDLIAMWRYVDYNFKSDKTLQDMNFNGPMFGATFRW